jgi:hypothetical protein
MVKTYQNLELFGPDFDLELSILESRKHNQAVIIMISGGLQSRSTPKRIVLCRKAGHVVTRGLRKSSSLTNGMSPGRNKTALRDYGTEARGLNLSQIYVHLSMRPSWASADTHSIAMRGRR